MADKLPELRKLLLDKKYAEARDLMSDIPTKQAECYLPLGFLHINYQDISGLYYDYKRKLSLDTAVMDISYGRKCSSLLPNYSSFERKLFISKPHDVFVMKITSKVSNNICMRLTLDSDVNHSVSVDGDSILMEGQAPTHMEPVWNQGKDSVEYDENKKSVKFNMLLKVIVRDGDLSSVGNGLRIMRAKEVIILINAQTSFVSFDKEPTKTMNCLEKIEKAVNDGFDVLLSEHIKDYQDLYNRSSISLTNENKDDIPTDIRLSNFKKDSKSDIGMAELLFNFGKYLLIDFSLG